VVFGTALLGFGIWLAADQSSIVTLLKLADHEAIKDYGSAAVIEQLGYVLIALGAFIFIISFLGYCGTIKESRFLLGAYSFFLSIIFILEIVVVVLFVVYRAETEQETRNILTTSVHKFYSTRERANAFTLAFDFTMVEGKCCGVNDYLDFTKAELFQTNKSAGQQIPVTCCHLKGDPIKLIPEDSNCIRNPTDSNSYYKLGCFTALLQKLETKMNIAIVVGVIVACLQIIGIVFAICVYKAAYYDYK
jgi:tetraspanin-18